MQRIGELHREDILRASEGDSEMNMGIGNQNDGVRTESPGVSPRYDARGYLRTPLASPASERLGRVKMVDDGAAPGNALSRGWQSPVGVYHIYG